MSKTAAVVTMVLIGVSFFGLYSVFTRIGTTFTQLPSEDKTKYDFSKRLRNPDDSNASVSATFRPMIASPSGTLR